MCMYICMTYMHIYIYNILYVHVYIYIYICSICAYQLYIYIYVSVMIYIYSYIICSIIYIHIYIHLFYILSRLFCFFIKTSQNCRSCVGMSAELYNYMSEATSRMLFCSWSCLEESWTTSIYIYIYVWEENNNLHVYVYKHNKYVECLYIYMYIWNIKFMNYTCIYIYIHIYKEKQLCYITSGKQMIISTNNMCIYKEKLQKRYMYILFKVFLWLWSYDTDGVISIYIYMWEFQCVFCLVFDFVVFHVFSCTAF